MIPHLHYKNLLKIMFSPKKLQTFPIIFKSCTIRNIRPFKKILICLRSFFLYGVEDFKHNICTREKTLLHISFAKLYWIKLEEICQRSTCYLTLCITPRLAVAENLAQFVALASHSKLSLQK